MIAATVLITTMAATAPPPPQLQALTAPMAAADLPGRMKAVLELQREATSDPQALDDDAIQAAVVGLLENENARIAKNLVSFQETGKNELNEEYAEYYAKVLGLANGVRKNGKPAPSPLGPRLRRALVFATYNPDSAFAMDLALEGQAIVPLVLELSRQPSSPEKWNAHGLIGELIAKQDAGALAAPLTPSSLESLKAAARAGLLDPAPDVRISAILAVSKAKDFVAIPMLERLATSDPEVSPGKYGVRAQAAETLKRLR